jgi:hypothetical protein
MFFIIYSNYKHKNANIYTVEKRGENTKIKIKIDIKIYFRVSTIDIIIYVVLFCDAFHQQMDFEWKLPIIRDYGTQWRRCDLSIVFFDEINNILPLCGLHALPNCINIKLTS